MKKTMLCAMVLAAGGLLAGIVEETKSRPVLAASAELAPFGDITKKVNALGAMINNPIVPALLIGSGQQQIAQTYGKFRSDSPMYWQVYVQTPAVDVAGEKGELGEIGDLCEVVLVYPSAVGAARMALNHPGSTKEADGTLHILANEDDPDERWVKFTADGKYCAFAKSAALANLAINDFAKSSAARKARAAKDRPLVRVEVAERGVSVLRSFQKGLGNVPGAAKTLDAFVGATFSLDLDDRGLSTETTLLPRPGAPAAAGAGFALPAGALDLAPAGAPLFFFGGSALQCGEAEFRADLTSIADYVRTNLVVEAKKSDETKKYGALFDELSAALANLLREIPYPSATDWSSCALAFDAARHPYVDQRGNVAKARETESATTKFLDRVIAALDRQWPGKGLLSKLPDGIAVDWAAVIDVAAAESGLAADGKESKEIANAKKTVAAILGGAKTEIRGNVDGTKVSQLIAAVGVKPAAAKADGEARVAAALPETAANRPAAVFYLSLYGLVRDFVLPTMAKFASKKDADQYKTMIAAMAPAAANSALAGAAWQGGDGSFRTVFRITANELKNFGAAFNAFTAASMSSALGDDEDDDK